VQAAVAVVLSVVGLALMPAAAGAPPPDDRPEQGASRRCNAGTATVQNGQVLELVVFDQVQAITHPRRYDQNSVLWSSVRKVSCRSFWRLMMKVLPAADELVALEQAGWRMVRLDHLRIDGVDLHQLWAAKGKRRVIYVRRGRDAIVDQFGEQRPYRPGQNLGFYRSPGVAGQSWTCTGGYVLRQRVGGQLVGLTAGHCSNYPFYDGGAWQTEDAERQDIFLGQPRHQVLGAVISNTEPSESGPDALVFALDRVPLAAQQIEQGSLTPLRVTGWVPTRRQRNGMRVCFTGRTSGLEECGRIYDRLFEGTRRLVCAHVKTDSGDSGGPVYTRPRDGAARAVGIVKASRRFFGRGDLCYTPIETVLEVFGATLPTGVFRTA
jgi:hypothetical protein